MGISHYIKEIGRGKEGARPLSQDQACDLMGQILDGRVSELELGAFCMAMRIKGETPQELLGFLQAIQTRLNKVVLEPLGEKPVIVIPSYNGARRLPLLTPLLAGRLQQEGFSVLLHGHTSEDQRVSCESVIEALGWPKAQSTGVLKTQQVLFINTRHLCAGLAQLLEVRKTIGLRNSAHSLAKLINPISPSHHALLLTNYTHPEYEISMSQSLIASQANALLLRGTEGEAVADPRRTPKMTGFVLGKPHTLHELSLGALAHVPDLPQHIDPVNTARYIDSVLAGVTPCPLPISQQVDAVLRLSSLMNSPTL
jgi:anthranilate phosphoribosyltransferase